ncbi:MAG: hypothetical protein ACXWZ6_10980 [Solirubrobacterales bacterium]
MRARRFAAALVAFAGMALSGAASAPAATSLYAPDAAARDFATSSGGWAGAAEYDNPICVGGVTCPIVGSVYVGTGGAGGGGDGFIRTDLSGLVGLSLLGAERGIWSSPQFTYAGAQGKEPKKVTLSFKRRADDQTLLAVPSAAASYGARLRDVTDGLVIDVVPMTTAGDQPNWSQVPDAAVDPKRLIIGHAYVLEIVTETQIPVAVIPAATFDYDDVVLSAEAPGSKLTDSLKGVLGKSAVLRGSTLLVPVKCPKGAPAKCRVRLVGKLGGRKSKSATKTGKVGVKPGGKKVARLRVKPRALAQVQAKKRMVFRAKVSSGGASVVAYRKLRIIRR